MYDIRELFGESSIISVLPPRGHDMFSLARTSLSTREHTMWRVEFDGARQWALVLMHAGLDGRGLHP